MSGRRRARASHHASGREQRLVLFGSGEVLDLGELPSALQQASSDDPEFRGAVRPLDEMVRRYAEWALAQLGGRRVATAEQLEIDRKTLARILDEKPKT